MDGFSTIILSNGGGGAGINLAELSRYVSALTGQQVDLAPPVVAVLDLDDLDDPTVPITPLIYDGGALTLTLGVNAALSDLMPFLTLGAAVAFRFLSGDRERSGVYTITDIGANDPGGHPAVVTRRADLDSDADVDGTSVYSFVGPDPEDDDLERLYQLQAPFPKVFDSDPLEFDIVSLSSSGETIVPTVASYPANPGEVVLANATDAPLSVTLPPILDTGGRTVKVKKTDVTANAVTVAVNAADSGALIDGGGSFSLDAPMMAVCFYTDGFNWWVF